jgi:hypothetical protein
MSSRKVKFPRKVAQYYLFDEIKSLQLITISRERERFELLYMYACNVYTMKEKKNNSTSEEWILRKKNRIEEKIDDVLLLSFLLLDLCVNACAWVPLSFVSFEKK